jgi:GcrA cell cycle regulator
MESREVRSTSPWPVERENLLRELFDRGFSAAQIADRMGGSISRSAVIGKLHRLKLTREKKHRCDESQPAPRKKRATSPRPAKPADVVRPAAVPILKAEEAPSLVFDITITRVSILEAKRDQCRYPAADDGSAMMVCGATVNGGSYCAAHRLLMIRKPVA